MIQVKDYGIENISILYLGYKEVIMSEEITSVKLRQGSYYLTKVNGSQGESGSLLESLKEPEGLSEFHLSDLTQVGENGEIHVGCRIKCGSLTARSFQYQDWWMTSCVQKILDFKEGCWVLFETLNSTYKAGVCGEE